MEKLSKRAVWFRGVNENDRVGVLDDLIKDSFRVKIKVEMWTGSMVLMHGTAAWNWRSPRVFAVMTVETWDVVVEVDGVHVYFITRGN